MFLYRMFLHFPYNHYKETASYIIRSTLLESKIGSDSGTILFNKNPAEVVLHTTRGHIVTTVYSWHGNHWWSLRRLISVSVCKLVIFKFYHSHFIYLLLCDLEPLSTQHRRHDLKLENAKGGYHQLPSSTSGEPSKPRKLLKLRALHLNRAVWLNLYKHVLEGTESIWINSAGLTLSNWTLESLPKATILVLA